MTSIILNIETEDTRWTEALPDIAETAEKVKEAVFSYVEANEEINVLRGEKPITLNLCLSDDAHVQQINRDFRNKDKPTNIISFANLDFDEFDAVNSIYDDIELGDMIIAYETMVKEAEIEGITLYAHFCHLLTHGFLHLLGFDHIEEDEAEYMEHFETEILASMGIANPYKEDE